jgi:hypothetical protein
VIVERIAIHMKTLSVGIRLNNELIMNSCSINPILSLLFINSHLSLYYKLPELICTYPTIYGILMPNSSILYHTLVLIFVSFIQSLHYLLAQCASNFIDVKISLTVNLSNLTHKPKASSSYHLFPALSTASRFHIQTICVLNFKLSASILSFSIDFTLSYLSISYFLH